MRVIYTAYVLDNPSKNENVPAPYGWKRYFHHQTVKFGDQKVPSNLGQAAIVEFGNIYADDKCVCVETQVKLRDPSRPALVDGPIGHITIATNGVAPKYSNEIVGKEEYRKGKSHLGYMTARLKAFVVDDETHPAYWI